MQDKKKSRNDRELSVEMVAPWAAYGDPQCRSFSIDHSDLKPGNVFFSRGESSNRELVSFLIERNNTHKTYIVEKAKTERLTLLASTTLFLAACLVLIFAPEDRQFLSYFVGTAMILVAARVGGFKKVTGEYQELKIGADSDSQSVRS